MGKILIKAYRYCDENQETELLVETPDSITYETIDNIVDEIIKNDNDKRDAMEQIQEKLTEMGCEFKEPDTITIIY